MQHGLEILGLLLDLALPGADVEIVQVVAEKGKVQTADQLKSNLKLAGFSNIQGPEPLDLSNQPETVQDFQNHLKILDADSFQVIKFNCRKPDFETGSSRPLSFASKVLMNFSKKETEKSDKKAVWSLNDVDDEEVDFLDQDDLIDEEDLKKPDASSLRGKWLFYQFII